ncbi:MAG: LLM class flavin-dependent oxidoreductase [Nitrososphaeria archaeon]|nr:LLM class flavin-dependent oxidoreductase [Nitrososphaeria archaeon]
MQYYTSETQLTLFDDVAVQLQLMEKYGYYSSFIGERHLYEDGFLELMTTMTAMAAKSKKLKIGSNVILLPLYNPLLVAEWGATLDRISKGRLILGVGLGYRLEELEAYGISPKERVSRLEEAVMLLRRFWSELRVTHSGKHFNYNDVYVSPKPIQKPHPPIYIGGEAKGAISRAARIGDGWSAASASTESFIEDAIGFYREKLREYGKDPSQEKILLMREAYIARDHETARRILEPHLTNLYWNYAKWGNPHITAMEAIDFDKREEDTFIVGNSDECIGKVEKYKKMGVDHLVLRFQFPGMSQEDTLEAIKLWGEKVIPYFKER